MNELLVLTINSVDVQLDKDDKISITDLWKASGSKREQAPNFWINQDSTQQLIETVCGILNATQNCIIKTKRGKGGGTYAHKQIALAYAKYLSPELHYAVNQVFFERIEEEQNPELVLDRAYNSYKKKGWSDEHIKARFDGKFARQVFTDTLKAHGVHKYGYALCTKAITIPIAGGSSKDVLEKLGLPKSANFRDHMSPQELILFQLAETVTSGNIKVKGLQGNSACAKECSLVAKTLAEAVNKITANSFRV
ncbi:KilA-N domain-containing protein [Pontibacter sp. KCTC 32443]|uniref:KilA-N domain-containing protein n=1 Tax=Pontibacter TaxID=323449 RepID=UPI00164E4535|nr:MULTISPECIES: KilA-N domain-containing protein [Pontibacter]MBC5772631.1 KilA-N domain-containing protein [Pontibacter sp. KCTC 32443]